MRPRFPRRGSLPTTLVVGGLSALGLSLAPAQAQHGTVSLDAVPVATAEDPDSLVTAAEDPDELVATSEGDPAPAASSPAKESPSLAAARSRLDQANAAYSNMLARNYPRGDARAAIIAERDSARAAYQSAGGEATED